MLMVTGKQTVLWLHIILYAFYVFINSLYYSISIIFSFGQVTPTLRTKMIIQWKQWESKLGLVIQPITLYQFANIFG